MATPKKDYSSWTMQEGESLLDYYTRLTSEREGGILGTGGLMDMPKEQAVANSDVGAGQVQGNCPPGYVWNGNACVLDSRSSDPSLTGREAFEATGRGQELGRALGSDEAWEAEQLQNAVDRLTGKSPTIDDTLGFLASAVVPGASLASALGGDDEEMTKLREYIGSDADLSRAKESLMSTGMTEDNALRTLAERDSLGWQHAIGMTGSPSTRDWVKDDVDIMDTIGTRLSGVGSTIASLFNTPDWMNTDQSRIYGNMSAGQRGAMYDPGWAAKHGSLMTGGGAGYVVPSYAMTAGNNFDVGMFTQDPAVLAAYETQAKAVAQSQQNLAAEAARQKSLEEAAARQEAARQAGTSAEAAQSSLSGAYSGGSYSPSSSSSGSSYTGGGSSYGANPSSTISGGSGRTDGGFGW